MPRGGLSGPQEQDPDPLLAGAVPPILRSGFSGPLLTNAVRSGTWTQAQAFGHGAGLEPSPRIHDNLPVLVRHHDVTAFTPDDVIDVAMTETCTRKPRPLTTSAVICHSAGS